MPSPLPNDKTGLRPRCGAAWYWTKVVILNNLLNGSPDLPYYAPEANSGLSFFGLCGGIWLLGAAVAGIIVRATHVPPHVLRGKASLVVAAGVMLAPLAVLFIGMLLKVVFGRDRSLMDKWAAFALLEKAVSTEDPRERRRLAEEARALDPENIRCNAFLGWLHENEFHEAGKAIELYAAAIRGIDRAIMVKKRKTGICGLEEAMKAHLLGRQRDLTPL